MSGIILTDKLGTVGKPFAELMNRPSDMNRVCESIYNTAKNSFRVSISKQVTQKEFERRVQILMRWFRIFRADLGFTISQSLSELENALKCELEGNVYQPPPKNRLWVAQGE